MSMHHVGRCDWDECCREKPLKPNYGSNQFVAQQGVSTVPNPLSYSPPEGWLQIEGKAFCSWSCVALYAQQKGSK